MFSFNTGSSEAILKYHFEKHNLETRKCLEYFEPQLIYVFLYIASKGTT